jgi:tRNA A37 threonylcarbamoyladenosine synthetase subunit TsaC/SUA5/YrdC
MPIILAQTDTTVGFLSQESASLMRLKGRDEAKSFLKVFASLALLKNDLRIPLKYRATVRHAKKTTFIIKNQAIRYVQESNHANLIHHYGWLFSTSANESGKVYDSHFCHEHSDIIIEDSRGFTPSEPSTIIRLTATQFQKLR